MTVTDDGLRCTVNDNNKQSGQYLSAQSVGCPERHRESFTVATDVVTVVEDGVLGTEENSRTTVRQISAV